MLCRGLLVNRIDRKFSPLEIVFLRNRKVIAIYSGIFD